MAQSKPFKQKIRHPIMNEQRAAILNQLEALPALPATVSRVLQVTGDPDSSAHDLMVAIFPDQVMCATILKLANSAFFGMPRQVNSVEKAITVLGYNEIRNIVVGKAVFTSCQSMCRNNRDAVNRFWDHSFHCGLAAKIIAEELRLSASELFIAGLIHDIGKLIILVALGGGHADILTLADPTDFSRYLRESDTYAIGHDEIAIRLFNRWLFPRSLINAVGYHHRPQESPFNQVAPIIVHVADLLSLAHLNPQGPSVKDIYTVIEDFLPELKALWKNNGLDWSMNDFVRWQEALAMSSDRDRAILSIMAS
jgi:HD-like signal output (HDOD) protein